MARVSVGERFGNWVVSEPFIKGEILVGVRCACGTENRVQISCLKSGGTTSCGCGKAAKHAGEKYGYWLVLARSDARRWLCRCVCGREKLVFMQALRCGKSTSCGCARTPGHLVHGHARKGKRSPTHATWMNMLERCKPHHKDHKLYFDRGITVCVRWYDFSSFLEDMGNKPDDMSIDRIDNDKGYTPTNCRWATSKQQANNRRNSKNREVSFAVDTKNSHC